MGKNISKKSRTTRCARRGIITITERGKNTLNEDLSEINIKYLSKFEEFIRFKLQSRGEKTDSSLITNEEAKKQTPEELLESGYESIKGSLEEEILSKLKSVHPSLFERIVVQLLIKNGIWWLYTRCRKSNREKW